jgi:hypothetical protein
MTRRALTPTPEDHPSTDHCSGGLSRTWRRIFPSPPPWESCCDAHDLAYWRGATMASWNVRRTADLALMACVTRRGYPFWAIAIYIGVRLGGGPFFRLRKRAARRRERQSQNI